MAIKRKYTKQTAVAVGVAIAVAIYLNVDSSVGKAIGILTGAAVAWGMLRYKG